MPQAELVALRVEHDPPVFAVLIDISAQGTATAVALDPSRDRLDVVRLKIEVELILWRSTASHSLEAEVRFAGERRAVNIVRWIPEPIRHADVEQLAPELRQRLWVMRVDDDRRHSSLSHDRP